MKPYVAGALAAFSVATMLRATSARVVARWQRAVDGKVVERQRHLRARGRPGGEGGGGNGGEKDQGEGTTGREHGAESNARDAWRAAETAQKRKRAPISRRRPGTASTGCPNRGDPTTLP